MTWYWIAIPPQDDPNHLIFSVWTVLVSIIRLINSRYLKRMLQIGRWELRTCGFERCWRCNRWVERRIPRPICRSWLGHWAESPARLAESTRHLISGSDTDPANLRSPSHPRSEPAASDSHRLRSRPRSHSLSDSLPFQTLIRRRRIAGKDWLREILNGDFRVLDGEEERIWFWVGFFFLRRGRGGEGTTESENGG